ncbi:MAG TPA: hypothetical protein VIA62_02700 [Thermoanaerobaculia bacterium]|jgi:hypothetical protein|nr:hypothetical protein [Thermoanaerobaculia bacterium]
MNPRLEQPGLRRRPSRSLVLGLASLTLIVILALVAGTVRGQGSTSGVTINFTQFDWLNDDGSLAGPYTQVGVAELSFDSSAAGQLVGPTGAFVNLYTSQDGVSYERSIENLFLQFDTSQDLLDAHPTVILPVGTQDGVPAGTLCYQVAVTTDPLPAESPGPTPTPSPTPQPSPSPIPQPSPTPGTAKLADASAAHFAVTGAQQGAPLPGPATCNVPVTSAPYLVGGYNGGGSGAFGQPPRPPRWQPGWAPGPGVARPALLGAAQGPFPTVNEDNMGCAPGGVARSIRYMLNRRGLGGPTAQNIYAGLYAAMGTGAGGTTGPNMFNGKAAWARANGYRINTQFPVNTLPPVLNALNNRGDVELNITWQGGGHVAMVTRIDQLPGGLLQITYVDGLPQTGRGGAPRPNATHVIVINPANGLILAGFPIQPAIVATFMVENM